MDDLTRQAFPDPGPDPAARGRAHRRLREAMDAKRPGTSRRTRLFAIAAVVVALGVLVASILFAAGGVSPASAELRRLGEVAGEAATLEPGAGQFVHSPMREHGAQSQSNIETGTAFTVISDLLVDTWIGADGSGYQQTKVLDTAFASPEDRQRWDEAGRPDIPKAGDVDVNHFKADEAPWFDLSDLPTDPDQLADALHSGSVISWPTADEDVFALIGDALGQGNASPALRAALFQVASQLDGVELLGTVADPLGRSGVGLRMAGDTEATVLVFDPATSQLLSNERWSDPADGSSPVLQSWTASYPAEIVDSVPVSTTGPQRTG